MRRERVDVAIVGSGFAGSLMALILARQGRGVLLLERFKHPRFALGEASTPFANLLWQDLAERYDLPRIAPLSKYGPWLRTYPELPRGLKRGFSFFQHHTSRSFQPTARHEEELLVGASPSNEVADTHWYRPGFDHFLVREVQAACIPYLDEIDVCVVQHSPHWILRGDRGLETIEVECDFVIDASGPGAFLPRALGITIDHAAQRTHSWSIYSHFSDVGSWREILADRGASLGDYPYPCDDSSLHHILDGGWMWVLPFDHGITSAGLMLDGTRHGFQADLTPEAAWHAILARYPSVQAQFSRARAVQPFFRTGRLQRVASVMSGPNWVLLPHAAYALDALFSIGNAHTLLGIERLADIFVQHWRQPTLEAALEEYASILRQEITFADELVHACYQSFGKFRLFAAVSMFYFACVHTAEMARREGRAQPGDRFLSSHHASLRASVRELRERIQLVSSDLQIAAFEAWLRHQIAPFNQGGFCDPAKFNLYPSA